MTSILIDTPASIRSYISGGKGGYGYSSTELHRLVERTTRADITACRKHLGGKVVVRDGAPSKRMVEQYGACLTCWPEEAAR